MSYDEGPLIYLFLAAYAKAPLEPQEILQVRQAMEELSAILPGLPTAPGPRLQELAHRGIVPQEDWVKYMKNVWILEDTLGYFDDFFTNYLLGKLEKGLENKKYFIDSIKWNPDFAKIANELAAPLWKEFDRMDNTQQFTKDLPEYTLKISQDLKKILLAFRQTWHRLGEKDNELHKTMLELKWLIMHTGLFAPTEEDMDVQLELAQESIRNKTFTKFDAFIVLKKMVKSTKDLMSVLRSTIFYYDPTLACQQIFGDALITSPQTTISHEQHAELTGICKKLGEVSECLEELCDFLKAPMEKHLAGLRQIVDELFEKSPELRTSPGALLQELASRGIMPEVDWTKCLKNVWMLQHATTRLYNCLFEFLLKKEDLGEIENMKDWDNSIESNPEFQQIARELGAPLSQEFDRMDLRHNSSYEVPGLLLIT